MVLLKGGRRMLRSLCRPVIFLWRSQPCVAIQSLHYQKDQLLSLAGTKRSRQTLYYFATGLSVKTPCELRKEKSMSQIAAIIETKEEKEAANKPQEE